MWRQAHVQIPLRARLLRRAVPTALVAVLVAALTAGPADASVVHVPRAYFGLHDSSREAYQHLDVGSLRLWDAGVSWSQIETSPGVYDWNLLDSFVHAAQQHHTQVTLVLAMTPAFYGPAPISAPDRDERLRELRACGDAALPHLRRPARHRGVPGLERGQRSHLLGRHPVPARPDDPRASGGSISRSTPTPPSWLPPSPCGSRRNDAGSRRTSRSGSAAIRCGATTTPTRSASTRRRSYAGRLGGPEDAMRLARDGQATASLRPACRASHTAVGHRDQLRPDRPGHRCHAHLRAPAGRLRHPHLRPRRRARSVADVLVPLRLGRAVACRRGGTSATLSSPSPAPPALLTPAGAAVGTAESWLRGRLVGRHGPPAVSPQTAAGPTPASCGTPVGCAPSSGTPSTRSGCPMPSGARTIQTAHGRHHPGRRADGHAARVLPAR